MKKIALVAAIAAIAAPAFAQSSVTLWGRINTSVESQKVGTGDRKVVVQNNSSRLGFKGQEDLGGGMKVSFKLEHGLNSDSGLATGGSTFWNRESSIQLSGGFGAVRMGKWTSGAYYATADYISMHNHDTGTSSDNLYSFVGTASTNKIGYFTPTVNGFSAELAFHAGEGVDKRAFDLSANYDQGPMHLGAGYTKQGNQKQIAARGLYEMGAFTFGAYVQRETVDGLKYSSRTIGRLAGMYALGASEFHINYGGSKAGGTLQSAGAKQYTLGYNYNLSKRTKVYGFYTAEDSKINSRDFSSLAAGIRHNF
jgi:predicted porin